MKLISSIRRFKSKIFTVTLDHAVEPDGFEIRRAIVRHSGSAVMMPVDDRGRILLVRQYRLPARDYLWEIPAGRLDPGESPLLAAKRELKEETGLRAKRWTELVTYYPSPGFLAEKMTVFVAQHLEAGDAKPMDDERIEARWFSAAQVDRMIRTNEIKDGKTIIAFLMWRQAGRSSR